MLETKLVTNISINFFHVQTDYNQLFYFKRVYIIAILIVFA